MSALSLSERADVPGSVVFSFSHRHVYSCRDALGASAWVSQLPVLWLLRLEAAVTWRPHQDSEKKGLGQSGWHMSWERETNASERFCCFQIVPTA